MKRLVCIGSLIVVGLSGCWFGTPKPELSSWDCERSIREAGYKEDLEEMEFLAEECLGKKGVDRYFVYEMRGNVRWLNGQARSAIVDWERVAASRKVSDERRLGAIENIGRIYQEELGDYVTAMKVFEAGVKLSKKLHAGFFGDGCRMQMAELHMEQGNYLAALAELDSIIPRGPSELMYEALGGKAACLLLMGANEEAVGTVRTLEGVRPLKSAEQELLAMIYIQLGKVDSACKYLGLAGDEMSEGGRAWYVEQCGE